MVITGDGVCALIAAIIGAFVTAAVASRLANLNAGREIVNRVCIDLSRAVERFRVATTLDHWRIAIRREADHAEYQRANADINIAMMAIRFVLPETAILQIGSLVSDFQRVANSHINDRDKELVDAQHAASNGGMVELPTPAWAEKRKDLHMGVENELHGRGEALLREIRRACEAERKKHASWRRLLFGGGK